ncbi:MAG: hypothetical protein QOJ07_3765, partial [Thermoleophilaceae bacterium]|nr:hypothetical protein [Thermoleophilaceae bacterium]
MAIREKLHTNAQPFLEPGEQVQAIFPVQSGPSPYLQFLTWLVLFLVRLHVVAVTDRRILVVRSSIWKSTSMKQVEAVLPRETRLGPLSGLWAKLQLGDNRYWCHKRFQRDAHVADELLGAAAQPAALAPASPSAPQPAHPAGWYDDP